MARRVWNGPGFTTVLAVTTAPAGAVSFAAIPGIVGLTHQSDAARVRRRTISGRPAWLIDLADPLDRSHPATVVATTTAWGDLALVVASGTTVPSHETMIGIAASLRVRARSARHMSATPRADVAIPDSRADAVEAVGPPS